MIREDKDIVMSNRYEIFFVLEAFFFVHKPIIKEVLEIGFVEVNLDIYISS